MMTEKHEMPQQPISFQDVLKQVSTDDVVQVTKDDQENDIMEMIKKDVCIPGLENIEPDFSAPESVDNDDILADLTGIPGCTSKEKMISSFKVVCDDPEEIDNIETPLMLEWDEVIKLNKMKANQDIIKKDLDILELKEKLNKSQKDLLSTHLEVVARDTVILSYMKRDIESRQMESKKESFDYLLFIKNKYGITSDKWQYDDKTGLITFPEE